MTDWRPTTAEELRSLLDSDVQPLIRATAYIGVDDIQTVQGRLVHLEKHGRMGLLMQVGHPQVPAGSEIAVGPLLWLLSEKGTSPPQGALVRIHIGQRDQAVVASAPGARAAARSLVTIDYALDDPRVLERRAERLRHERECQWAAQMAIELEDDPTGYTSRRLDPTRGSHPSRPWPKPARDRRKE